MWGGGVFCRVTKSWFQGLWQRGGKLRALEPQGSPMPTWPYGWCSAMRAQPRPEVPVEQTWPGLAESRLQPRQGHPRPEATVRSQVAVKAGGRAERLKGLSGAWGDARRLGRPCSRRSTFPWEGEDEEEEEGAEGGRGEVQDGALWATRRTWAPSREPWGATDGYSAGIRRTPFPVGIRVLGARAERWLLQVPEEGVRADAWAQGPWGWKGAGRRR